MDLFHQKHFRRGAEIRVWVGSGGASPPRVGVAWAKGTSELQAVFDKESLEFLSDRWLNGRDLGVHEEHVEASWL